MSKGFKIIFGVLIMFGALTALHVWLNIGFENLPLAKSFSGKAKNTFRVGFLPVT